MRKSMIIALTTLLCISFAGCKNSAKTESGQPDIKINHVEDDNTKPSDTSKESDNKNTLNNSDHSESEREENEDASTSSETYADSEYELAVFASDNVSIISGKKYDKGETNIHGTVLSIGKYTVVMNKAFTAEYTPDGQYIDTNTMASFEDPDEQIREFVQFNNESTFTLRETKNSGAESKDSSAAFEDIKTGDLLDIRGTYIDGLFNAQNTIIYRNLDIQK